MTNLEKTIQGLKCCLYSEPAQTNSCGWEDGDNQNCPYNCDEYACQGKLMEDALALLKAQAANSACTKERCPVNASAISDDCNIETCPWRTEALIPRLSMSGLWYECPACGRHLTKGLDNYCARCGKRVKWG